MRSCKVNKKRKKNKKETSRAHPRKVNNWERVRCEEKLIAGCQHFGLQGRDAAGAQRGIILIGQSLSFSTFTFPTTVEMISPQIFSACSGKPEVFIFFGFWGIIGLSNRSSCVKLERSRDVFTLTSSQKTHNLRVCTFQQIDSSGKKSWRIEAQPWEPRECGEIICKPAGEGGCFKPPGTNRNGRPPDVTRWATRWQMLHEAVWPSVMLPATDIQIHVYRTEKKPINKK